MDYSALGYIYQNGKWYRRDGTPLGDGAVILLAQACPYVAIDGVTIAQDIILASVTLPGGMMGKNGRLEIRSYWDVTNSANVKTASIRVGAVPIWTQNPTTVWSLNHQTAIHNAGALNSQRLASPTASTANTFGATSGGTSTPAAIDTSVDQVITFVANASAAGDTIVLVDYTVLLYPSG